MAMAMAAPGGFFFARSGEFISKPLISLQCLFFSTFVSYDVCICWERTRRRRRWINLKSGRFNIFIYIYMNVGVCM